MVVRRSRSAGRRRSRPRSRRCARQRQIGIVLQRDAEAADPGPDDLHRIGTVANILRYVTGAGRHASPRLPGRAALPRHRVPRGPALPRRARSSHSPSPRPTAPEIEARFLHLQQPGARGAAAAAAGAAGAASTPSQAIDSPGALADLVAAYLDIKPDGEAGDPGDDRPRRRGSTRSRACSPSGSRCCGCRSEIGQQTKASLDERQREVLLREQMAAIQRQLGEGDGKAQEIAELDEAIAKAGMPRGGRGSRRARSCAGCERMPEAAAEYGMVRTYLDWLVELPWALPEAKPIDIAEARRILDEDHFGLDKIKQRIVEYLAVRKLAPEGKAPILCFVGPPGVGKTSLGQSIARAMGRPVRARQPRRRARRGRDPRPSPHLYRRAARQHHPGDPQGRRAQLRDDARRDRQDGPRHPGRSVVGDARGARPRAERHLPRQLSRRAVRPLAASSSSPPPTCSTPSPGRCATAWRSSALAGYTEARSSRSPGATWCAASSRRTA